MQLAIMNQAGTGKGVLEIPEELLSAPSYRHLWWQVAEAEAANRRSGTASTKTRAEVRGGGAKPWRQKGTGRARQGSRRAPHWVGGGVASGPRPRGYDKKVPRRQRRVAFYSLLVERLQGGEALVVESLQVSEGKTREVVKLLGTLIGEAKDGEASYPKVLLILPGSDEKLSRAAGNVANVRVCALQGMSFSDLLWADRLILAAAAAEEALEEAGKWLVKRTAS